MSATRRAELGGSAGAPQWQLSRRLLGPGGHGGEEMGTRARQAIRKIEAEMTKQNQLPARRVPTSKRPVRVKLRRINCDYHVPYAPESIKKDWWARLKKALGTASPDFVAATLRQIEIASRLPSEGYERSRRQCRARHYRRCATQE